jgi:hypothetical protein
LHGSEMIKLYILPLLNTAGDICFFAMLLFAMLILCHLPQGRQKSNWPSTCRSWI